MGSQTHFPKDTLIYRAWENAWIKEILHRIQYAVKQGCVGLRDALRCTSDAMLTAWKPFS